MKVEEEVFLFDKKDWTRRTRILCGSAWVACFACVAVPQAVFADQGIKLEQEEGGRLAGSNLVLNGVGIRNFLIFDFYEIALFLPEKMSTANAVLRPDLPRRVRITLLKEVVVERDLAFLLDGLDDNNTPEELAAIRIPLDEFLNMLRALRIVGKGSVVEMDYLPNIGTRIWLDRRFLGSVPGTAFNRSILKIWLGERPIQKNLKKLLLGGNK